MANKLCLLICEHYQDEVRAVFEDQIFENVTYQFFQSHFLHDRIEGNIPESISISNDVGIEILGSTCTGNVLGQSKLPDHVRVHHFTQCFHQLAAPAIIDPHLKTGAYLTTPGWVKNWQKHLEDWGFDQSTAQEFFHESTSYILLLDTGIDPDASKNAQAFASYVKQSVQVISIGLDYFRMLLKGLVLQRRLDEVQREADGQHQQNQARIAQYAMSLDLLSQLAHTMSEEQVIRKIFEVFGALFAPQTITYLSFQGGIPEAVWSTPEITAERRKAQGHRLADVRETYGYTVSGKGFNLEIKYQEALLGVIEIEGIAFPEYIDSYLNVGISIVSVCGLAISNARTYQEILRVEEELRKSRERYRTVADFTYDWEYWISNTNAILYMSPSCERVTGYKREEFLASPERLLQIVHEDDVEGVELHLLQEENQQQSLSFEYRILNKEGNEVWLHHVCQPVFDREGNYVGRRASNKDITERRRTEDELQNAHRLAGISTLAAGMAHEINSPLQVITSTSHSVARRVFEGELSKSEIIDYLDTINRNAWKISEVVRATTLFTNPFVQRTSPHDINKIIKDAVLFTRPQLAGTQDIQMAVELEEGIPPVECDRDQVMQVVVNLLSNAYDALHKGGLLSIKSSYLTRKQMVRIVVEDSGEGISTDIQARIFDPFFTTKEIGKGKGLGLSVAKGAVLAHHGEMHVESTPEEGTCVTVTIPLKPPELSVQHDPVDVEMGRFTDGSMAD